MNFQRYFGQLTEMSQWKTTAPNRKHSHQEF